MSERKPLIAGNWKMFKTGDEAVTTAKTLANHVGQNDTVDIMIAPPFTALSMVAPVIQNTSIALSAQNMHWEKNGAYTGEISADMLVSAGCKYVILGHSERRQYFHETDDTINQKIHAAINAGLKPVFCVGETENERNLNKTFSVLDRQVEIGLKGVDIENVRHIIIAYEPVWAIGTGKTATDDQAQDVHAYLRQRMNSLYHSEIASAVKILYGGSVKPKNIKGLMAMADIDGALVGGASLDAETFAAIVQYQ
ncbi:MAG: Triosephosphate isomerase [Candidatus Magnetoglobus multicellularis str. Araruama]|uniref:Triosephosphate isomerase n=1 Tax=Candidatus Magnetoglobus multicellularis str. Araruama TaxID=890399 RepID=A0A1V1PAU5_9BACT|nr:MAG: Triosephosphate isomerase [Candidatus Magnetoglobus multicellularis str. Araruama]